MSKSHPGGPSATSKLRESLTTLERQLSAFDPWLSERCSGWLSSLARGGGTDACFAPDWGFPIFELPRWVADHTRKPLDVRFERELRDSTLHGYCFVRLLDDIADADSGTSPSLLPLSAFFHTRFVRGLQHYFAAEHPFWVDFDTAWLGAAAAAVHDAALADIALEQFCAISARKCAAAKIPVAAVCHHYAVEPAIRARWLDVCELLGRVVQMADDLADWSEDLNRERGRTFLLCEAERRRGPKESVPQWLVREGLTFAMSSCEGWLNELEAMAASLGSTQLSANIVQRRRRLKRTVRQIHAMLVQLAPLARHFDPSIHARAQRRRRVS